MIAIVRAACGLLVVGSLLGVSSCRQEATREANEAGTTAVAAPVTKSRPPAGPAVDNSRCHVCHINYAEEELAVTHAAGGVGCEKCHGRSDAHCSDEDNVTAPDVIYARAKIDPACMHCHPEVAEDPEIVAAHKEVGAGKDQVCTDCHGKHRLRIRTRTWDKETKKLIVDDNVRMISEPAKKG